METKYFYCYDQRFAKYLKSKGFDYITMQFNLINYPKFNESTTRKQNKNNTESINNNNHEKATLQLPDIINELNLPSLQ